MAIHLINNTSCETSFETLQEEVQRLSLAFEDLEHFPTAILDSTTLSTKTLDLSYNSFSNLSFLRHFPNLTCLILDHNQVNSATTFPTIAGLKVLWLNHNRIDRLFPFIQRLQIAYPHLEFLSLMANEAVPVNVDDSTFYEHLQYRLFVISWFPYLKNLDGETVREAEIQEARRLYKRPLLERLVSNKVLGSFISGVNSTFSLMRSRDLPSDLKPSFI